MKSVIAVIGYAASGKEPVTNALRERGFQSFSGGDVLRSMATKLGLPHDRDVLINMGNVVREEFGPEILVRAGVVAVKKAPEGSRFVFDSLRNPAEIDLLKRELDALVVEVTATPKSRLEWMIRRGKPGDPKTIDELMALDAIDQGVGQESTGQNIKACIEKADLAIQNDGTLEDLERKVDELLASRGIIEGNRWGERR